MQSRFLTLAMALAMGLACGSAQAQLDDVVVMHADAGTQGKLSIFNADVTTSLASRDGLVLQAVYDGTGKLVV
jgi:hypothetical protein